MQNRVEHHMSQVGTTKQWLYPNRPLPFRHVIWIFCYSCMWSPNTNMLAATPHLVPGVPERWQLPIISSMLIVFYCCIFFGDPKTTEVTPILLVISLIFRWQPLLSSLSLSLFGFLLGVFAASLVAVLQVLQYIYIIIYISSLWCFSSRRFFLVVSIIPQVLLVIPCRCKFDPQLCWSCDMPTIRW
jgi:hypothetical protein